MNRSATAQLDPVIHEPARLTLVAVLNECDVADFNFLLAVTGFTRGRLSTHMAKLIEAGYIDDTKEFIGRKPHTEYRLTKQGRASYSKYLKNWKRLTGRGAKEMASARETSDTPRPRETTARRKSSGARNGGV